MSRDDQFRTNAISAITREISDLTGGKFEAWGYRLMNFLAPNINWDHRGTTVIGAPVKSTVDSSGAHAQFAVQYSSVQNYFDGKKPVADLDSTVQKHPDVRGIWLLAAVQAAPSEKTDTDNAITSWKNTHPGISVETLDGRQLATFIVDHLDSDEIVAALQDGLPSLARIADENAFSHSLPTLGPHVPRADIERSAAEILENRKHILLAGISGVGKSEIAIRLARALEVDTQIWVDATSLRNSDELKSLSLHRRGLQHNIYHLLKTRKCVVVLDNLLTPWSESNFNDLVGSESFLIITSQTGGHRSDALIVANADKTTARQILEIDTSTPCPAPIFEDVWTATTGHPLLLRLLGRLADENDGSWMIVREYCETIISHGEDQKNEKICRRILRQHLPALQSELAFFLWCDSPSVDAAILAACVSPLASRNLQKRHFLAVDNKRIIRLHDVVFISAKVEITLSPTVINQFRNQLNRFIVEENNSNSLIIERFARKHNDLLMRELQRSRGPEVLCALARARVDLAAVNVFGDIVSDCKKLRGRAPDEIAVHAIIEAIEATYSLTAQYNSKDAAQNRLNTLIEAFEILESMPLPSGLLQDVRHHYAKMLTRLEEWGKAERIFKAVLDENPKLHATKLQLVRLLARDRKQEAIAIAKELIAESPTEITPTIRIATWVELARLQPEFVGNQLTEIVATLRGVSERDVAASYGLVAQVASRLAYTNPEAAITLFDELKDSEPTFSSDRERFDWARAQVAAAKALRYKAETLGQEELLKRARVVYEAVPIARMPEFNIIQYSENLLLLNDFAAAKKSLESVESEKRSAFWWHRYAQTQLHLGDLEAAYLAINQALSELKELKYRPAFLELRFDIRERKGDSGAAADLVEAISLSNNDKYKEQLERILAQHKVKAKI